MHFLRIGGQRTRSRRQKLCGVVCSGRAESHDEATAKAPAGPLEQSNQWKIVDGCNLSGSAHKPATACSPLQFILDDLASPAVQPVGAFKRAVCVPFHSAQSSVRAALELKVRMLLLDNSARSLCTELESMRSLLNQQGLRTVIMHPGKPPAGMSLFARSINVPFLVVTSDDTDELVVVDGALREHLLVAPCTPAYEHTLAATIPELFIGTPVRLQQLVKFMSSAISLNFASQGADVPPWRRTSALLGRWAVIKARQVQTERQLQLFRKEQVRPLVEDPEGFVGMNRYTSKRLQRSPALYTSPLESKVTTVSMALEESIPPLPELSAEAPDSDIDDNEGQVSLEWQVHAGSEVLAQHDPIVVVRGFEVGTSGEAPVRLVRERNDAGQCVKPGGLASLCRKPSSGAPSSAGSDGDGAWGASPSSVFRGERAGSNC